jgi:hypothetical protein
MLSVSAGQRFSFWFLGSLGICILGLYILHFAFATFRPLALGLQAFWSGQFCDWLRSRRAIASVIRMD